MTTKGTGKTGGISRRTFLKTTAGTAALRRRRADAVSVRRARRRSAGTGGEEGDPRLHRADRRRRRWSIAKEKGFFAKHGMPDVDVAKQASWGATRDNLVLGSENNGIDGAHILRRCPT